MQKTYRGLRLSVIYLLLVGIPCALVLAILWSLRGLRAPEHFDSLSKLPSRVGSYALPPAESILQLAIVLVVARLMGTVFQKIRQPRVVGEMAAGILLGPSLLGAVAPKVYATLFSPVNIASLVFVSHIGLVLFMFIVGMSVDLNEFRRVGHAAVLISQVGMIVPFAFASLLALALYTRFAGNGVEFVPFALFLGAAMSITAFPVLARILTEQRLLSTPLGSLTVASAAAGDVTGWCLLTFIVVISRRSATHELPWLSLLGVIAFGLLMFTYVRRALPRLARKVCADGVLVDNHVALILILLLVSAWITNYLGVHLLFGAFMAGAIMPRDANLIMQLRDKFESITVTLFLPLFFTSVGLSTDIGVLRGGNLWAYCIAIICVATVGKFGGCFVAARMIGVPWRDAAAIGLLMNTRGLMELVILNLGLEIGVISPPLFSMMVLMALVTTIMTTPFLEWIYPAKRAALSQVTVNRFESFTMDDATQEGEAL
jgi:Kef-type K+ transport system membrane component KefB